MQRPEFAEHFGHINEQHFQDVLSRWHDLPPYTQLPPEEKDRAKHLTTLDGAVKEFTNAHLQAVNALTQEGKHFEALSLMNQRMFEAPGLFKGDYLTVAKIFGFRRKGRIREHLATFGEYSKLPLTDFARRASFLGGAIDYMSSDLELGCVTDFAMRTSECFGGAGFHDLQMVALQKVFGPRVQLVGGGTGEEAIMQALIKKATTNTFLGKVPSGGSINVIKTELPDPRNN